MEIAGASCAALEAHKVSDSVPAHVSWRRSPSAGRAFGTFFDQLQTLRGWLADSFVPHRRSASCVT